MRIFSLLLVSALLLTAAPAMAGKVSYADGKGRWVTSACETPRAPAATAAASDTAASDLNARVAAHNNFATATAAYMDCISQEAQRDADTMSHMIVNSAQEQMAQMQAEVEKSGQLVGHK